MAYPSKLAEIVSFFESLSVPEKRENLIVFAENAASFEPRKGERYTWTDVRKDAECSDTVGVFLKVKAGDEATFRVSLGPEVQTLTRALASIFCKGFDGARLDEILETPPEIVPRIVGADLVRARSQTVYYMLGRMKEACSAIIENRSPD